MNMLNKLKTAVLVTSIMLLPTVSYAMDQGEHTDLGRPSVSSKQLPQEKHGSPAEKDVQNQGSLPMSKMPTPIYNSGTLEKVVPNE